MECWKDRNIVESVISLKDKIKMSKFIHQLEIQKGGERTQKKETYDKIIIGSFLKLIISPTMSQRDN